MATRDAGQLTEPIVPSDVRVPIEDPSFLRAVLEAIPAFVVRTDPEQRINYINHLRGGLTLDRVLGRPVREFIAPEDLECFERAVERAFATGRIASYQVKGARSVTPSGPAHYEGHAVPIDNGDGRRAICFVASDVSEHVARANALQQSEEQLRMTVEATGIGLWSWDVLRDHVEWNQRMVDIMGCEAMPVREYVARLVHPGDRARMTGEVRGATTGEPQFLEHRIVRPDGEVRWVLPCGRAIKDDEGRVVRMIGGTIDVTERRRIEEQLRNAQKLDAIGGLTAGVMHNFNNMLAVIVPTLEVSLRKATAEHRQMVEDALHAARRATELTAQLTTFAGHRRAAPVEPHPLAPVVESAVSMCRSTFDRQLQIEARIDAACAPVPCEPMAVEQVVVNLLINARDAVIEAGRSDPRIGVELCEVSVVPPDSTSGKPERYARLRVVDNGSGMTDDVKRRLFEPFYTTKEPGKGTGLGLATSYGIVRSSGGFITFDSEHGAGTTATVFFPVARETLPASAQRPSKPSEVSAGKILVVDDEPTVRRIVELVLGEYGHQVHAADSGAAAVQALDAGLRPDLILLDRSMPGWSVKRTIEELRKRAGTVPILAFTGQDVTDEERAQVDDVLYKPLSSEQLVQSVEHWLARRAAHGNRFAS